MQDLFMLTFLVCVYVFVTNYASLVLGLLLSLLPGPSADTGGNMKAMHPPPPFEHFDRDFCLNIKKWDNYYLTYLSHSLENQLFPEMTPPPFFFTKTGSAFV